MGGAQALINTLWKSGISVEVHGDQLICNPGSKLTDDLRHSIRQHKAEIIQLLQYGNRNPLARSITAYSEKLNRRITVSWTGDDPRKVFVDCLPFNLEEIASMKNADPTGSDLEKILMVKRAFGLKPD